ncbi:type I polyketide synthase [Mycobacterium kansasii]|uniref:type I polyketide synthase n=1 Tax=Mycobacterium kansasii TaxID=1768 RepID=UPI000CDDC4E9|nr:type I polyketide synthase [Mycobacterium kansasii]POY33486.1 beta-ketoacyl synthase [Mycobacterium kansasii]
MPEDSGIAAPPSLLDVLLRNAEDYADKVAFDYCRYLPGGEEHSRLTYRELDIKARAIAAVLQQHGLAGERVLVLCPSGLDFLAGFFGCVYAGAAAVPVHPPVRDRVIGRVSSIIADVQARFVLTTAEVQAKVKGVVDGLAEGSSLQWCAVDAVRPEGATDWIAPDVDPDAMALVQYTSGSTSTPKGVMVTHRNLLSNLETIRRATGWVDSYVAVSWLPPHHDMGLISMILGTVSFGGSCHFMPPEAFIERPMRWLEALSRYGGTITAAPNFAYDLCVERSSTAERAALDLSKWLLAVCAAEPVRAATLDRFADAFGPSGFAPEAFKPAYGLAEATLLASGQGDWIVPLVRHVDPVALREHHVVGVAPEHPSAVTLVGCGPALYGVEVVIVDPDTRMRCADGGVGEIWLGGGGVAQGYWGEPSKTQETFSAFLADSGRGPFLRTGDLGFFLDGELFVTGRLKDLIIIRGRNYYPEDIEAAAQDSHSALLRGRGAAFSVTPSSDEAEQLVVVQEVDRERIREADVGAVIAAIRTAITERHEIAAHAVVLAEPLRIPTTSSGKIRRNACRQRFLDGSLEVFAEWHAPAPRDPGPAPSPVEQWPARTGRSTAEIAAWLISRFAQELGLPATEIDTSVPFAHYGLDSVRAIRLTSALETWLGCELSPTVTYEHPTIDLLSKYMAAQQCSDAPTDIPAAVAEDGATGIAEPIAVIGIGCRFPGADGPAAFWQLLCDGVDAVTETPPDRRDPDASGNGGTRRGGFLEQIDRFDAHFFGISPHEAGRMDPRQRLLLEVAWEALEDAGQVPERLAGSRTGVFIGISANDYGSLQHGGPALIEAYTGSASSIAANRLSYAFDFRGPSMAIDTACSSSLVAVHQACRSLYDGESTMALAGGVNVILSPAIGAKLEQAGMMAADARCKAFDARADGYVQGEGAGIVVLKPLSRALADADPVYAVIRGSAVNHDGRTNGLTAPSRGSQEAVLADAYRRAGLSPGVVQYVETHGTATFLGDAIEAAALGAILARGRMPDSRCLIGSVKTNIGHLEAAAGVAGLIKVVLALRHQAIPPSLNFAEPNPHIPFDTLPLRVGQTLVPWPEDGRRAVAGVSSFGLGGTNAHVVVTEAPQVRVARAEDDAAQGRAELLPLSARSPEALAELALRYETALAAGAPLADLCHTAGARRGHYDYRLAAVGDSAAELSAALAAYRKGTSHLGLSTGRCRAGRPGVVFVFSGRGSQWSGMGHRLFSEEPAFREALGACDVALQAHMQEPLLTQLFDGSAGARPWLAGAAEPAIFAIQVGLVALWRSWGVEPEAVLGHGSGAVAAAYVAGALTLDDAAQVICGVGHGFEAEALRDSLAGIRPAQPAVPMYSTVTGDRLVDRVPDAAYWVENLCAPVLFPAAIGRLFDAGHDTFLEISPHPILLSEVRAGADERGIPSTLLRSMCRDEPERATMLASLGALYTHGQTVAWEQLHSGSGRCVPAPTYPWQRQRFWLDERNAAEVGINDGAPSPVGVEPAAGGAPAEGASLNEALRRAGRQERQRLLESYLGAQAAGKLGLTAARLDTQSPLKHLGLGSLTATKLRSEIERDLGIDVPVIKLLDDASVAGLADWLADQLSGRGSAQPDPAAAADPSATQPNGQTDATHVAGPPWIDLLAQVPQVSDDDVDELLRQVMAGQDNQDEGRC